LDLQQKVRLPIAGDIGQHTPRPYAPFQLHLRKNKIKQSD